MSEESNDRARPAARFKCDATGLARHRHPADAQAELDQQGPPPAGHSWRVTECRHCKGWHVSPWPDRSAPPREETPPEPEEVIDLETPIVGACEKVSGNRLVCFQSRAVVSAPCKKCPRVTRRTPQP